jgi:hypothetical protein
MNLAKACGTRTNARPIASMVALSLEAADNTRLHHIAQKDNRTANTSAATPTRFAVMANAAPVAKFVRTTAAATK